MRTAKTSKPAGVHIRLGKRWPRRRASVLDDGLLGPAWAWDDEADDDGPTRVRTVEPQLYLA